MRISYGCWLIPVGIAARSGAALLRRPRLRRAVSSSHPTLSRQRYTATVLSQHERACYRVLATWFCPRHSISFAPSKPRGHMRPSREGAGKTGCAPHPRSRVQWAAKKTHTSIQVQRKHSGLPCAMALRLIRDLPGGHAVPPSPPGKR
jgi:hypothetical protein